MIYKYCRRCGKRLKGVENRARGYGEICFQKARAEARRKTLVPPKMPPMEFPLETAEQSKAEQGKGKAEEQRASKAAEQGQGKQGRAEQAEKEKEKGARKMQSKEPKTPHLEKTLSPTHRKPLLFSPPTPTPAPPERP